jgi:hypothetical protein
MCTGLFNRRDIGRIEREFLDVLDFEMSISEGDILFHHTVVMALHPQQRSRVLARSSHMPFAVTKLPFRQRSDSDSSAYSDDSTSSDSLPATPPPPSIDVDAHVRSPSEGSFYSDDETQDLEAGLSHLVSQPPIEKIKTDSITLPRFSSALNLLRMPCFHAAS